MKPKSATETHSTSQSSDELATNRRNRASEVQPLEESAGGDEPMIDGQPSVGLEPARDAKLEATLRETLLARQEADGLRSVVAMRDNAIRDLQGLLAGARHEATVLANRLAQNEQGLLLTQAQLERDGARSQLASLQQTLDQQTEHLDALAAQIEFMSSRESELRQMLMDAYDQLLARDQELGELRRRGPELESLRRELEASDAFIMEIRQSKLWQIAMLYWAPLNWVRRLVSR